MRLNCRVFRPPTSNLMPPKAIINQSAYNLKLGRASVPADKSVTHVPERVLNFYNHSKLQNRIEYHNTIAYIRSATIISKTLTIYMYIYIYIYIHAGGPMRSYTYSGAILFLGRRLFLLNKLVDYA